MTALARPIECPSLWKCRAFFKGSGRLRRPCALASPAKETRGRRTGVFGGSYDPVHAGHVAAAEEAAERLGLDRVILVPAGVSPHKPSGTRARAEDRLAMTRLAVEGRARLAVSDVEVRRAGVSYTVDTVRELGFGLAAETELFLLLGTDALRELPAWREVDGIFRHAAPVVLERPGEPGVDWEELARALTADLSRRLREGLVRLSRGVDVSSTEIRRRFAAGESVAGLVPPAVETYIRERGLYGASADPAGGA